MALNRFSDAPLPAPVQQQKTHTPTHILLLGYFFGQGLHFGAKNYGVVWDRTVNFWGFEIFGTYQGG